jgi:hypothetical protein
VGRLIHPQPQTLASKNKSLLHEFASQEAVGLGFREPTNVAISH